MQRGKLEADAHTWRVPCGKHHAEDTTGGDHDLPQATERDLERAFPHIPQKKPALSITLIATFLLPWL